MSSPAVGPITGIKISNASVNIFTADTDHTEQKARGENVGNVGHVDERSENSASAAVCE